jgi:hypothetical protein
MTSHFSPDSGQVAKAEVLQHPHSPDLAPSHFYLFGPFKNFLQGERFQDQKEMQKTVAQYFRTLGKEYFEGMFKLVKR